MSFCVPRSADNKNIASCYYVESAMEVKMTDREMRPSPVIVSFHHDLFLSQTGEVPRHSLLQCSIYSTWTLTSHSAKGSRGVGGDKELQAALLQTPASRGQRGSQSARQRPRSLHPVPSGYCLTFSPLVIRPVYNLSAGRVFSRINLFPGVFSISLLEASLLSAHHNNL